MTWIYPPKPWRSPTTSEFGSRFHSPSQKGHVLAELPGSTSFKTKPIGAGLNYLRLKCSPNNLVIYIIYTYILFLLEIPFDSGRSSFLHLVSFVGESRYVELIHHSRWFQGDGGFNIFFGTHVEMLSFLHLPGFANGLVSTPTTSTMRTHDSPCMIM